MRRYDDPVDVRRGMVDSYEAPEQFLWRGSLWKVCAVLTHWVETGAWWESAREQQTSDLLGERECWRVEAGTGRSSSARRGVFDLTFSWADGTWQLVGCHD